MTGNFTVYISSFVPVVHPALLSHLSCATSEISESGVKGVPYAQMAERGIGFVGDITSIQSGLIKTLVETGYIPVVASVAADRDGQALNVNADIAAGEVQAPL